jgi:hypothetical protein
LVDYGANNLSYGIDSLKSIPMSSDWGKRHILTLGLKVLWLGGDKFNPEPEAGSAKILN